MSIATTGFLSPDIALYVVKHRAAHKDVFGLADALNALDVRFSAVSATLNDCNCPCVDGSPLARVFFEVLRGLVGAAVCSTC